MRTDLRLFSLKTLYISCLLSGLSLHVLAAPPLIPESNLGGVLQKGLEKQIPNMNALPTPGPEQSTETPSTDKNAEQTVELKGFKFEGINLLPEEEVKASVNSWIGKKVTLKDIQKAADDVAEFYRKRNFLVQTNIPPQDIDKDNAIILMQVLEAKLGDVLVELDENTRFDQNLLKNYILYQNPIGENLRTDQVEKSLYLLNELPGIAVASEIQPGSKDGEVALKIKGADKSLVSGYVGLSNYGNASTGNIQGLANLNINDPLGYGDQLALNAIVSQGSEYGQLNYVIPVGYSGLKLGFTLSSLYYSTINDFSGSQGAATNWGVNLSYPLLRKQEANANITFAYLRKLNNNSNLTTGTLVSDYVVNEYTFGFNGNYFDSLLGGGVSTASINLVSGNFTNQPDAIALSYGQYTAPTFTKMVYNLTRNQQVIADKMILNINVSGQIASGNLDAIERFYLGGPNGVRAYPSSQGSGDQGAMLNVDLQYQFPNSILGYVFYDLGWVDQYKDIYTYNILGTYTNAGNKYSLSGMGVGAKYSLYGVNLNGLMAFQLGENPLYRYDANNQIYLQQNNDGTKNRIYFWLQANYPF
jgi:hemolysin activation/secretion protein